MFGQTRLSAACTYPSRLIFMLQGLVREYLTRNALEGTLRAFDIDRVNLLTSHALRYKPHLDITIE